MTIQDMSSISRSGAPMSSGISFVFEKDSIYTCLVSRADAAPTKSLLPVCSVLYKSYLEGLPECQILSHTLGPMKTTDDGEELLPIIKMCPIVSGHARVCLGKPGRNFTYIGILGFAWLHLGNWVNCGLIGELCPGTPRFSGGTPNAFKLATAT